MYLYQIIRENIRKNIFGNIDQVFNTKYCIVRKLIILYYYNFSTTFSQTLYTIKH